MEDLVLGFETLHKNLYAQFGCFDEHRNSDGDSDEHYRKTVAKVADALLYANWTSINVLKSGGFTKRATSVLKKQRRAKGKSFPGLYVCLQNYLLLSLR